MSSRSEVGPSRRDLPAAPLAIAAIALVVAIATTLFPEAYPLPIVALGALIGTGTGLLAASS